MSTPGYVVEDLLLLLLDEGRGTFRGGDRLRYGLAAALLSDLAQLGRVSVGLDHVRIVSAERTGHRLLDECLASVAASGERSPAAWIASWATDDLSERVADRLITAGTLTVRQERGLGILTLRRFTIVPPRLRITLRAYVRGVVLGEAQALPPRIAALAAILAALDQRAILGIDDSADTRAVIPIDLVAGALARTISRRGNEHVLLVAVK